MGYTNATPQFGLPQYAPADTPQREDFNKAFKTISENMGKGGDVQSVNGKTGAVNLNANDVGAADATLSNVTDKAAALANLGAINKAGDTMTGELKAPAFNGEKFYLYCTSDGAGIRGGDGSLGYGYLNIRPDTLEFEDATVLTIANKPTGYYTGNGSAASRTINTGGIGQCCLVYGGNNEICIATPSGAFYRAGTTIGYTADITFSNGALNIASNSIVNTNQLNYVCGVL